MAEDKKKKSIESEVPQKEEDILIDETKHRNRWIVYLERLIALVLTALCWAGLLWYIYVTLTSSENIIATRNIFLFFVVTAVVIILISGGWQFYNWFLYHGEDRRKAFPLQSLEEFGRLYGIEGEDMACLQAIRKAAIIEYQDGHYYYATDDGRMIEIKALRERRGGRIGGPRQPKKEEKENKEKGNSEEPAN